MASKSIDWDELLLTADPKKKEIEVSFNKIDDEGYLVSKGNEAGTPGGVVEGQDGTQEPGKDPEGDFEPTAPPVDNPDDPDAGEPEGGGPIPPAAPAEECGGYDCNAFLDSILSENTTLSWHLWPTREEVTRAQTKGPGIEDDFGLILNDVWYYNNARGDRTSVTARFDTPSTNIGPEGSDITPYPLRNASKLRPCSAWARDGGNSFTVEHDISSYLSNNVLSSFRNPSIGANRNIAWWVEYDMHWYWEFGEDHDDFSSYEPNVDEDEKIYIAPSFTPTMWRALGAPTELIQMGLKRPAFKLYPRGGKVEIGPGGNADNTFTEIRPRIGTHLYPISGWYSMKVRIDVVQTPDPVYNTLQFSDVTYNAKLTSPMGIFENEINTFSGVEHTSPVVVRDWALVSALGVTVYSRPSYYPERGLLIATSPRTIDAKTKQVVERIRQGYTPPDYCERIP